MSVIGVDRMVDTFRNNLSWSLKSMARLINEIMVTCMYPPFCCTMVSFAGQSWTVSIGSGVEGAMVT